MDIKIKLSFIILIVFIISCKNQNKENKLPNSEQNEIVRKEEQETYIEEAKIDKSKIIEQLQGKWKENKYPYRTAEFVSSTVKFVEEGIEDSPKFEKFEISEDCQFDNNNIVDIKSNDTILILPETKRCEKLKITNDTLILSGFSPNNNSNYNIIYIRLDQ